MNIEEKREFVLDNINHIEVLYYNKERLQDNSCAIIVIQFNKQCKYKFLTCLLGYLDVEQILKQTNLHKYDFEAVYNTVHATHV